MTNLNVEKNKKEDGVKVSDNFDLNEWLDQHADDYNEGDDE